MSVPLKLRFDLKKKKKKKSELERNIPSIHPNPKIFFFL